METIPLTRRDFLKVISASGGVLAGSAFLSGCALGPTPLPTVSPMLEATATSIVSLEPSQTASAPSEPSALPASTPTSTATSASIPASLPAAVTAGTNYPLPDPRLDGGLPLMRSLSERHSTRSYKPDDIPVQVLSDLLWAAFGVNRPQTGGRTAPSAYGVQDIDIYLVTSNGLLRYQPAGHNLLALLPDDLRVFTGTQSFVAAAPVNLVYVSDYRKMAAYPDDRERWSWAHSGCIAQNVYLACVSLGLATVVRSTLDRVQLAGRIGLEADQHITLAQTVGYPA
jgi:SagB-type dehydrogenase family enzyme